MEHLGGLMLRYHIPMLEDGKEINRDDLIRYIKQDYLPAEEKKNNHIVITAILLRSIFKNYCVAKKMCSNEDAVFPKYYHYFTTVKESIHAAIYDYKSLQLGSVNKMMMICGSSTASGKSTFLATLGKSLTTDRTILLDEYPVKDDHDYRLTFAKDHGLSLNYVFICRDVLVCARQREKRMLTEQQFKSFSTLSPHDEAKDFVDNSIKCTRWFVHDAEKRLQQEPNWQPRIYQNNHGKTQTLTPLNRIDYYQPMSLQKVKDYLIDVQQNRLAYINKIETLIKQRSYNPQRMFSRDKQALTFFEPHTPKVNDVNQLKQSPNMMK